MPLVQSSLRVSTLMNNLPAFGWVLRGQGVLGASLDLALPSLCLETFFVLLWYKECGLSHPGGYGHQLP